MYSYCNNNPINNIDPDGHFVVSTGLLLFGLAVIIAYVTLPIIIEIFSNIDSGSSGSSSNITKKPTKTNTSTKTTTKSTTKVKADTKTKTKPSKKEIFPINPHEFNPKGLTKVELPGTNNGKIINWMQGKNVIFEWDEDLKNDSHYHALMIEWDNGHLGPHYMPLSPVPEPWNTIYFGGEK